MIEHRRQTKRTEIICFKFNSERSGYGNRCALELLATPSTALLDAHQMCQYCTTCFLYCSPENMFAEQRYVWRRCIASRADNECQSAIYYCSSETSADADGDPLAPLLTDSAFCLLCEQKWPHRRLWQYIKHEWTIQSKQIRERNKKLNSCRRVCEDESFVNTSHMH